MIYASISQEFLQRGTTLITYERGPDTTPKLINNLIQISNSEKEDEGFHKVLFFNNKLSFSRRR